MPTGTKIAAIVLVVLLGAAGLYYAFVPPAPAPKFDPSKGSTSGATNGSSVTDPLARPSTLPPAGASSNTMGAGAGIDALAGRTGSTVPGTTVPGTTVPGTTVPGTTVPGTTAPGVTVPGTTVPNGTVAGTATAGTTTPKYGFQNGRGTATPPGPIASGNNPTDAAGVNAGNTANTNGTAIAGNGTTSSSTGTTGTTGTAGTGTTNVGSTGASGLASSGSESTYVVKKGDTFETISKSVYGSTSKWKEIAKANPTVDPTRMKIGAKLRIPAAGASISSENTVATATPKSTSSSASSGGSKSTVAGATSSGTHVIAKGDTFSSLARAYYGDSKFWKAIAKANPKISEKSLAVGTKVAIPPKSAVVSGGNVER